MTILTLEGRHGNDWQDVRSNAYLTVNGRAMQVTRVERVLELYC